MNQNEVRYAGFWIRFAASFFDTLFLALPIAIVIYFVSDGNWFDWAQYQQNMQMAMSGNVKALENQPQPSLKWELLFEVSVIIVTILFWKRWKGATPGKHFVHIKIVDAKTHDEITNMQAITRSFGYIVSIFTLFIGFLIIGLRADKRGLHDLLAGTIVIYDENN